MTAYECERREREQHEQWRRQLQRKATWWMAIGVVAAVAIGIVLGHFGSPL
jgi:hypothetical protein